MKYQTAVIGSTYGLYDKILFLRYQKVSNVKIVCSYSKGGE